MRSYADKPGLFSEICTEVERAGSVTMPDGTVLDAAEAAAARLSVAEMRRQVTRLRRDFATDPEAVIGESKNFVETACKTILGLTNSGPETKEDLPALVKQTLSHLGLEFATAGGDDPTEARALQRVLGGLGSILSGAAELRTLGARATAVAVLRSLTRHLPD